MGDCKMEEYDFFLKQIGNNIRRIRKEKNLTMQDLSFQSEIDYRQIGRIERGEINTTIISLLRIANAFNVEIALFFYNP